MERKKENLALEAWDLICTRTPSTVITQYQTSKCKFPNTQIEEENKPTMESSLWFLTTGIVLFFLISYVKSDEVATTAASPETSLLCISECGTCPTVCVSPPPPPPPQSPLIVLTPPHDLSPPVNKPPPLSPPPPQVKPYSFSPVTPTQDPAQPSTGQKGSPYYYFYTSKATQVEFVFCIWSFIVPLYVSLALLA